MCVKTFPKCFVKNFAFMMLQCVSCGKSGIFNLLRRFFCNNVCENVSKNFWKRFCFHDIIVSFLWKIWHIQLFKTIFSNNVCENVSKKGFGKDFAFMMLQCASFAKSSMFIDLRPIPSIMYERM